jgi:hypothetical protein
VFRQVVLVEIVGLSAMEPLTTNATVLTVVYAADGVPHVGGFQLGIAPHGVQAAPQPPVEPRTRSRAFVVCA